LNNLANSTMHSDLIVALEYAKQANELQPSSAAISDTYGWVLAQNKMFIDALVVLRQAKALNANDPVIAYHLGFTLFYLDRPKEALSELQASLATQQEFSGRLDVQQLVEMIKK